MLRTFSFLLLALIIFTEAADKFTAKDTQALAKLKSSAGDVLKLKYFKDDYILIHFLRSEEHDVVKTIERLKGTAAYRKENNIDKIGSTKILESLFPIDYEGVDKTGRILAQIAPAKWDNRQVILAGNRDKLILKWAQFIERVHLKILKRRVAGSDVTKSHMIMDLRDYNLRQHACLQCFGTYFQWVKDWETHWPQIFWRFTYINTPRIFQPLLELLKPVFTPYTRNNLQVLGADQQEIKKELYKSIDPAELLQQFGGTRVA